MENIGRDDNIVGPWGEALGDDILLNVESLVDHLACLVLKLLLGIGEEAGRDVGECVGRKGPAKLSKNGFGSSP